MTISGYHKKPRESRKNGVRSGFLPSLKILTYRHQESKVPYIMETCVAGRTKEISKRYSARFGKKSISRSPNANPTPEAVRRVNERGAIAKLRRLINANYGFQDIHLVLTYRRDNRPASPAAAKKDLEKFLRRLRMYHQKAGTVLKYIAVTEYKKAAIHHHLIINSMDTRILTELWEHGQPRPVYLDNTGNYAGLAEYLVKETRETYREREGACQKRWSCSKNLAKPIIRKSIVRADSWRQEPKAPPDYYIEKASIESGYHEITGYGYQFYRLIKIEPGGGERMRLVGSAIKRYIAQSAGAGTREILQPAFI